MRKGAKVRSWLFFALAFLLVVGCRSARPVLTRTTETKDSTVVEYRDVLLPYAVAGDSVTEYVQVPCGDTGKVSKPTAVVRKNGRATLRVQRDSLGRTVAKCECDSVKGVLAAKEKSIKQLRSVRIGENITITKTEYRTHWYDLAARWIAGAFLLFLFFFIWRAVKA